jgi:hypothetical protein
MFQKHSYTKKSLKFFISRGTPTYESVNARKKRNITPELPIAGQNFQRHREVRFIFFIVLQSF